MFFFSPLNGWAAIPIICLGSIGSCVGMKPMFPPTRLMNPCCICLFGRNMFGRLGFCIPLSPAKGMLCRIGETFGLSSNPSCSRPGLFPYLYRLLLSERSRARIWLPLRSIASSNSVIKFENMYGLTFYCNGALKPRSTCFSTCRGSVII